MVLNYSETEERRYAQEVTAELQRALNALDERIASSYHEVIEAKKYIWENIAQLDPAERAAGRIDVSLSIDVGEKAVSDQRKVRKLLQSPYFGRIDFLVHGDKEPDVYYIGVHSFVAADGAGNIIFDWRSPVASMFYDFGIGAASYTAPMGEVRGEISLKRQYKIVDGTLEYMIESGLNINDDILQKELSSTSDEKMKHIVATIQQEQNVIIRNVAAQELIIQGVAGSGKTSIALHRVAFLLYRFKETINSSNVLIISPNKVFSDYISGVLPELGEEKILEASLAELAAGELARICRFQTFDEQVAALIDQEDEALIARIRFKSSLAFVGQLDSFIEYADQHYFSAADVTIEGVFFPQAAIQSSYNALRRLPVTQRLDKIAASLWEGTRDDDGQKLPPALLKKLKSAIKNMYRFPGVLSLYEAFYSFAGEPGMFVKGKAKTVEYSDVFPLIYLKIYVEGTASYDIVKHLLVDEMQDYTPIQYAVLAKLFPCKKTIMGDGSQTVNPYGSSTINMISKVFPQAEKMELLKSYRSTLEIVRFAQQIKPNSKLIPIERHGQTPQIIQCGNPELELEKIKELLHAFRGSAHRTLGIVCKSQSQAAKLCSMLQHDFPDITLLDFNSTAFKDGIVVTTAHMSKGLEFDQVIVPAVNSAVYRTELDRSLLYIACTRAMHRLDLTYSGELSWFLRG
ncbi:HelD family protein [Paenibacillus sp. GCM10027626]|uniref:HelD family protein n=1 Tax=Paenibacillus sp. GCM10027626 TaxID=3273411 RepID=UPI00362E9F27